MTSLNGDKVQRNLDVILLAVLERGESHGREILRRLEKSVCGPFCISEASLYKALCRLEVADRIKARMEAKGHGRRGACRRYYCITSKGLRTLAKERTAWHEYVKMMNAIIGPPE